RIWSSTRWLTFQKENMTISQTQQPKPSISLDLLVAPPQERNGRRIKKWESRGVEVSFARFIQYDEEPMTEPGSPDYAKQKLYDAVYALLGSATIDRRLTSAASYLMLVQSRDLPVALRGDFENLLRKLTRIPLSSKTGLLLRPISEDDAVKLAKAILSMLVQLLGGLVADPGPVVDREEVGTPSEFENMRSDEIEAALVKMMADHGLTVNTRDADKDKPQ